MIYISLPLMLLVIGAALCAPEHVQNDQEHSIEHSSGDENNLQDRDHVAKRTPHYSFGLGKRIYSYVSEYKRLPVYNFGLGKRSKLYSFGLGKRSIDEDAQANDDFVNDLDQESLSELLNQYDDAGYEEKRARPYSFGLGKRDDDDFSEDKRARTYNFGLGKRAPLYNFGLGKRAKSYNFGLGKRLSSKFNFGLGKRQRDLHRFNFGLGKRSADDVVDDLEA